MRWSPRVGSPQFQIWLFAPVILWFVADRARAAVPAILVLVLCALTFVVYPVTYDALLNAEVLPVVLLSIRNALLVAMFIHCVGAVVRVMRHPASRR